MQLWTESSRIETLDRLLAINEAERMAGYQAPCAGIITRLSWAELEAPDNGLAALLDAAQDRGLKVMLLPATKTRGADGCVPGRYGPLLDGATQDAVRYVSAREERADVYGAKLWNPEIETAWRGEMYRLLGRYGTHPACAGVRTIESSTGVGNRQLPDMGYPGAEWAIGYQVRLGKLLRDLLPADKHVALCINWILPENPEHQARIADAVAPYGIGWYMQDVVPPTYFPGYTRLVYPQAAKFQPERRWASVTGETLRADMSIEEIQAKIVDLGAGQVVLMQWHQDIADALIAAARAA